MKNTSRDELLNKLVLSLKRSHKSWPIRFIKWPVHTLKNTFYHKFYLHINPKFIFYPKIKTFFGESICISIPPCFDLLASGIFCEESEINLIKYIIKYIPDSITFFDLGANLGYYSLLVAKISNKSSIFAFEPNPDVLPLLRRNKRRNIVIVPKAVSNYNGTSEFYSTGKIDSGISTLNLKNIKASNLDWKIKKILKVEILTLDSFCEKNNIIPNFLKIDVEGAEMSVLEGSKNILTRYNLILAIEIWIKPFTTNYKQAIKLLESCGYLMFIITDEGDLKQISEKDLPNYFKLICDKHISSANPISSNFIFKKQL
ncbi:MAG: FkbM family methyltransferase [archaeon]